MSSPTGMSHGMCLFAEALFVTSVQPSDAPSTEQVRAAVASALRRHGRSGCAALVALEFGEHPECAVPRMDWALHTIERTFATRTSAA
jgi:hypothetical protein